jgi:hypothetical protein
MNFQDQILIAQTIAVAQEARESSWDNTGMGLYHLDHLEAAKIACIQTGLDSNMAQLIYLLNYSCWNDAWEWAEATSKELRP